jgi:hypothetical protein
MFAKHCLNISERIRAGVALAALERIIQNYLLLALRPPRVYTNWIPPAESGEQDLGAGKGCKRISRGLKLLRPVVPVNARMAKFAGLN